MQAVFKPKTHQAYDRRAKSDQVVTYIANKFLKKTDATLPQVANDFDQEKNAEEEVMMRLKEQRRKQQQLEMREMLDMQIQLQHQEKEIQVQERRAIG